MQSHSVLQRSFVGGVALMTVALGLAASEERLSKWGYLIETESGRQMKWQESGAELRDGRLVISSEHLKRMSFSEGGLAQILVPDKGWYYVKHTGESLSVITYDNGADYFAEGLTRSKINGKIAYFDASFRQVIPPKYDWAWPFENGKALVCNGCREAPRDSDGHSMVEGGQWGYIDRTGREIVPVTLSREEALHRQTN